MFRTLVFFILLSIMIGYTQVIIIGLGFVISGGVLNPLNYCVLGRIIYLLASMGAVRNAYETVSERIYGVDE